MSSATFIDKEMAQQFVCAICLDVINQPVQIKCIGSHIFCKSCIDELVQSNPLSKCPICVAIFNPVYNVEIPFIARQINALRVRCYHHPPITINIDQNNMINNNIPDNLHQIENINNYNKRTLSGKKRKSPDDETEDDDNPKRAKFDMTKFCEWIGCYGDLNNHIKQCQFEIIPCKHSSIGCNKKTKRKDMKHHVNQCQYAPVSCPHCKETQILRRNLEDHILNLCGMTVIKCGQCGDKMNRVFLDIHVKYVCSETLIECKYINYGCFMMKRKDKDQHNKQCMEKHLNLIEKSHYKLKKSHDELKDRLDRIERLVIID